MEIEKALFCFRRGRGQTQCQRQPGRGGALRPRCAHPLVAVPEGAAARTSRARLVRALARPARGRLQDRGLGARGAPLGRQEEPPRHELRQALPLNPPVLQEGHHAEDRALSAPGLPVLPPLQPVNTSEALAGVGNNALHQRSSSARGSFLAGVDARYSEHSRKLRGVEREKKSIAVSSALSRFLLFVYIVSERRVAEGNFRKCEPSGEGEVLDVKFAGRLVCDCAQYADSPVLNPVATPIGSLGESRCVDCVQRGRW